MPGADWIGEGRAQATAQDVARALLLILVACVMTLGALAAMVVLPGGV